MAITGAFVLPRGTVGMTDASTTRRPSMPRTLRCWSTTPEPGEPLIAQVPTGWYRVPSALRAYSRSCSSVFVPGPGANSPAHMLAIGAAVA